jgi:hypothetical protein
MKTILISLIIGLIAVVIWLSIPWILIFIGYQLGPNPSKPLIKKAEFPFKLEYSIHDSLVTVEDVLICEYDGIGVTEATGKYRKWRGYFASGKDNITLYRGQDGEEVYFPIGGAGFYMGDFISPGGGAAPFPNAEITKPFMNTDFVSTSKISAKVLEKKYGLRLINLEIDKPINNEFK